VPNCKSFLVTRAERKHVMRRTLFQQHRDASCHQVFFFLHCKAPKEIHAILIEKKQQSVEWRHSGSPRPKNSECKNPLEKFSPRFFGIKKASSSLIMFQRAKLSTRSITHLCWCNGRKF